MNKANNLCSTQAKYDIYFTSVEKNTALIIPSLCRKTSKIILLNWGEIDFILSGYRKEALSYAVCARYTANNGGLGN